MKDDFPGFNRKSEAEIKNIWQEGIIVFDTNVLLNLYRYSKSTRETIINLIGKFKNNIWLPHQAALEYNKNRYEVIADQEKAYKQFILKIDQIKSDLQSTSKPPFLSESVHLKLNKVFDEVKHEVEGSINKYSDYLKSDPIYTDLIELFEDRITKPFNETLQKEIIKQGEDRYKMKVPPGYEDVKNKNDDSKYGDLLLWKQVISLAKELSKPVLLITDERKTDWWWKIKDGRNMGPRHELVAEMKKEANVDFHMYSSERFLSYGQNFLKEHINEKALKEIEAMKKAEIEHLKSLEKKLNRENIRKYSVPKEVYHRKRKYDEISQRIMEIERLQEDIRLSPRLSIDEEEYLNSLSIEKAEVEQELEHYEEKLKEYNEIHFSSSFNESQLNDRSDYERFLEFIKSNKNKH